MARGWRRSLGIGVWSLLLLAAAWQTLFRTPVASDMGLFLPTASSRTEELAIRQIRGGPASRLILIAIEGEDDRQLAQASRELAERLRASELFSRVENGEPRTELEAAPNLFEYRYLLGAGICELDFDTVALGRALQARLDELASPLAPLTKRTLAEDPTACQRALLTAWRPNREPRRHMGVWFSPTGERTLLVAQTHDMGSDLNAQAAAIGAIRAAFGQDPEAARLRLHLTGPGAFAVASKEIIHAESRRLSLLAVVAIAAVLLYSFRSLRLLLLGGLPLLAGLTAGVAAVGIVYGGIHGITLAFGVTLLGVAVDYPIHAFSHWKSESRLEQTIREIWPTVRLGLVTTALGYLALSSREFPGLTQLALFTVSGLIVAAFSARWMLPALAGPHPNPRGTPIWWRLPDGTRFGPALVAGLAALAAGQFLADDLHLDADLARLSPIPASQIDLDRQLRSELGAPEVGHMLLVTAANAEAALQASEALRPRLQRLVDQGALGGYDMAARYLPSRAAQQRQREALPDPDTLGKALDVALEGLPFRQGAFAPFLESVVHSQALTPLTPNAIKHTLLGTRVSGLLYPGHTGWNAIVPLIGVSDPRAIADGLDGALGDTVHLLDLKAISDRIVGRFLDETLSKLVWIAAAILFALTIGLRDTRRLLRVAAPVATAIALDLALLSRVGIQVNLFHVVSLLLVMGLAIDYSLFFSRAETRDPGEARRTFASIATCALTTFTMFAILASSEIPVLHAIGVTVSAGVAFAFLTALLLFRNSSRRSTAATS